MQDLDELLQSLDGDGSSGPDLEYDPEFTALVLACRPGEDRVVGDSVIPAEEPDHRAVLRDALKLLGTSRDLRIAVILANAALRTEGLIAFERVLRYIRGCLEDHWDSLHPLLDPDDDDDPTMRVNAVLGLTDRAILLASLRAAALTDSRTIGRFGLRDLQIAEGDIPPAPGDGETPTTQLVLAAFQDTDPDHLAALAEATADSLGHVQAITAAFDERIGALGPDLTPLRQMLQDIKRRLAPHVAAQDGTVTGSAERDETLADGQPAPSGGAPAGGLTGGAIASPDDVRRAIDRIIDYYARVEPSSPVPLLLGRARRLVAADFVTIMKDMAPLGVENIALISGLSISDD